MPGYLEGLLTTKAERRAGTSEGDYIARATGSSTAVSYGGFGLGPVGAWDIDRAVNDALEKVTWVFRCVDVIATNQANLWMGVKDIKKKDEGDWIEDDRVDYVLNYRANSYEMSWQFRYRLTAILLLSRRGAFVELVWGADGRISEMHILPPGVTMPIPDPKKFVKGYRIQRSDWQVEDIPTHYPNGKRRVIWLRVKPHPTDPYAQMTPLVASGISAETDWFAHMFNRNFLANDGRPGMLINIQGMLNSQDAAEIKAKFANGPMRAGQAVVIESPGIDVKDMSTSPRDVQWDKLLELSKEELLMAFGVPESIMGNASGRTFDNADAERANFWLDTEVPHCSALAQGLDPITGSDEDNMVLSHDYKKVDVLQRVQEKREAKALEELQAGAITIDEYRTVARKDPWNVPATRTLVHPLGILMAQNETDQKAVDALKIITMPEQPSAEGGMPAQGGPARLPRTTSTQSRALRLVKRAPREIEAKKEPKGSEDDDDTHHVGHVEAKILGIGVEHPYLALRHHLEGTVEGALTAFDHRQEEVITDRLMHVKMRKGTRHWDVPGVEVKDTSELKALDGNYAVEIERWKQELPDVLRKAFRLAIFKEARKAGRDLQSLGIVGKGHPLLAVFGTKEEAERVLDLQLTLAMQVLERAAENQSRRVAKKIEQMDAEGATMKQIEKEIRRLIGTRSPWRKALSTNLVTSAIEGARNAVYSAGAGKRVKKVWHALVDDSRTRDTHFDADGQERKIDSTFRIGAAWLMHPGDFNGPPEEVINCRCWLEFRIV